jgi:hypothetical protein
VPVLGRGSPGAVVAVARAAALAERGRCGVDERDRRVRAVVFSRAATSGASAPARGRVTGVAGVGGTLDASSAGAPGPCRSSASTSSARMG